MDKNSFMPTKNILSIIVCVLFLSIVNAQESKELTNDYISSNDYLHNYQLEKFYIHTNKSTYYAGEKVWFKVYVVNDTNDKPSLYTSNLHINLFNSNRELISSNLFLVENGKSYGNLDIPKETKSGEYYIELTSQWNQNFKNNSSVSKIKILNGSEITDSEEITEINNSKNIQLDFFPNTNLLLENTINQVAFKISNNNQPLKINGDIIDTTTGIITSKFQSNKYGMGEFKLFARENRTYKAVLDINGEKKEFELPKSTKIGFLLEEKNKKGDSLTSFKLKTNKETLKRYGNKKLYAVLHRNGFPNAILPIEIDKKHINYIFGYSNNTLFNGVNFITIFNQKNQPISEFSFFNSQQKEQFLNVRNINKERDSISLKFDSYNNINANLSVSVLSQESKVGDQKSSIFTAFLLAPYLNTSIDNILEFYNSKERENLIELLLKVNAKNQFESKIETKNLIPAENGLTIKGNVSSNIKNLEGYQVMLSSEENAIFEISPIGESNTFSFENLILKHPSKYKMALLNKSGEIIRAGFKISYKFSKYKPNKTLEKDILTLSSSNEFSNTSESKGDSYAPIFTDDTTMLDVVYLSKKQKREQELKKLGIKAEILNNGFSEVHVVKGEQAVIGVYDYLKRIPGIRVYGLNYHGFTIKSTRGPQSILGDTSMAVFVDGVLSDTEYLLSREINDFIAISVNSSGAGAGVTGMGGTINFYTKKSKYATYKTTTNKDIVVSETEIGFKEPSEYNNDLMTYANSTSKKYYGSIGWFPNVNINPEEENILKFSKDGNSEIMAIINGMDDEGNLFYKVVYLND